MSDLAQLPETGTGRLRIELARRLAAEALGTGFLLVAVVGSGIMASRLSPGDAGIELLENAAATTAALIGLILVFGAVSGAHFNPVVTLVNRAFATITTAETALYITAQVIGACLGTMLANLMFELPLVELSTKTRSSGALWVSEIVATVRPKLGEVPARSGIRDPGLRLFPRRYDHAGPAVLLRGRGTCQPPRSRPGCHSESDRRLGRPAGSEPDDRPR